MNTSLMTPWHDDQLRAAGLPNPFGGDDEEENIARHDAFSDYLVHTLVTQAPWLAALLFQANALCEAGPGFFRFRLEHDDLFYDVPYIAEKLQLLPWQEDHQTTQ